ncbi:hypothetical protein DsansV1_C18g0150111 [Dioscorea sansibarensis]
MPSRVTEATSLAMAITTLGSMFSLWSPASASPLTLRSTRCHR